MNLSGTKPNRPRIPTFVDLHKANWLNAGRLVNYEPVKGVLWEGVYRGMRILLAKASSKTWQVWITGLDGTCYHCTGHRYWTRDVALNDAIFALDQHLEEWGIESGPVVSKYPPVRIYKKGTVLYQCTECECIHGTPDRAAQCHAEHLRHL